MRDDIPPHTTYVPGSLIATSGTVYTATDRIEWTGDLPYTTTHTNTSGDYEWGDSLGRGVLPGVKYDWIEISETGIQMGFYAPNSGKCYPVPIPFGFNFYGTYYTQAGVQIDGSLYFPEVGEEGLYPGPNNQPIPHDNVHLNRFIAPLWDDLYQWPGGIYYQVLGTAPYRRVVIEYSRFSRLESETQPGDTGDFEIILYEGSSAIKLQYKDVDFDNPLFDFGASRDRGHSELGDAGRAIFVQHTVAGERIGDPVPAAGAECGASGLRRRCIVACPGAGRSRSIPGLRTRPFCESLRAVSSTLGEHADQHRRSQCIHQDDRSGQRLRRAKS